MAHLFRRKVIQILRRTRYLRVMNFTLSLRTLHLGFSPLGVFDAGLDLSVVFVLWLDEMVVEMGAVGVYIRVAGVPLLFSVRGVSRWRRPVRLFVSQSA